MCLVTTATQALIKGALEDFVPEFGKASCRVDFNELIDAFHRAGGVMGEQLRAHVALIEAGSPFPRSLAATTRVLAAQGRSSSGAASSL